MWIDIWILHFYTTVSIPWMLQFFIIFNIFLSCVFHSCAGLLITYVALNLMDGHGQPALLYIVPFTLGM